MNTRRWVTLGIVACALAGCYREKREFQSQPASTRADRAKLSNVLPGGVPALQPGSLPAPDGARVDANAYAVNQGKRLFRWYNCSGCHSGGGGGNMGPPLMDREWRYGHAPQAIYASIVEGRPNGMPAFGGRIPDDQLWQIVAYVRSLSGQLRKDVAPSRSDSLSGAAPENERDQEAPTAAKAASAS
jgi:cytochrome c oxidase cbb3-type subunit 3